MTLSGLSRLKKKKKPISNEGKPCPTNTYFQVELSVLPLENSNFLSVLTGFSLDLSHRGVAVLSQVGQLWKQSDHTHLRLRSDTKSETVQVITVSSVQSKHQRYMAYVRLHWIAGTRTLSPSFRFVFKSILSKDPILHCLLYSAFITLSYH